MFDNLIAWLMGLPGWRNYKIEVDDQVIQFRARRDMFGLMLLKLDGRWRYYGPSWDATEYELNYNKCYNRFFRRAAEIRPLVFPPRVFVPR